MKKDGILNYEKCYSASLVLFSNAYMMDGLVCKQETVDRLIDSRGDERCTLL